MKKFALIAATLIAFAGCARNDETDLGATGTTDETTGTGAAGSSQIGTTETMTETNVIVDPNTTMTTPPPPPPNAGAPGSIDSQTGTQPYGTLEQQNRETEQQQQQQQEAPPPPAPQP